MHCFPYPILTWVNKFTKESVPLFWQNTIMIGRMRWTVSVDLVTSLPQSEMKNSLETITFGVALPSLVKQHIVLSKYIKRVHGKFDNRFN